MERTGRPLADLGRPRAAHCLRSDATGPPFRLPDTREPIATAEGAVVSTFIVLNGTLPGSG